MLLDDRVPFGISHEHSHALATTNIMMSIPIHSAFSAQAPCLSLPLFPSLYSPIILSPHSRPISNVLWSWWFPVNQPTVKWARCGYQYRERNTWHTASSSACHVGWGCSDWFGGNSGDWEPMNVVLRDLRLSVIGDSESRRWAVVLLAGRDDRKLIGTGTSVVGVVVPRPWEGG